jgi:membrane protein YfhO
MLTESLSPGDSEDSPRFHLHQALKEYPVWILILLCILFFFRPIFFGDCFFFRDLSSHFIEAREIWKQSILHGQFPLWNPYLNSGQPFLANPNNLALYPTNLLYLFLPISSALTFEIVGHYILAVVGLYFFSRSENIGPTGAFAGAILYGFSGVALSLSNLLNWLFAFALLPYALLFWKIYLIEGKKWAFFFVVVTGSLQVFAGAPEMLLFTLGLMLFWAIATGTGDRIHRKLLKWFLVLVMILAAGCIQILPALELSKTSMRGPGLEYNFATGFSLHPHRLVEIIFSGLLGNYESLRASDFWGFNLESGKPPFLLSIYFGPLAVILACASISSISNEDTYKKAKLYTLTILTGLAWFLSIGRFLPGFQFLFEHVPGFDRFRYPSKFMILSVLPLSLLAGSGLERIYKRRHHQPTILLPGIALFLLASIFTVVLLHSPNARQSFFVTNLGASPEQLRSSMLWTCFVIIISTVAIHFIKSARLIVLVLTAILIVDLFLAGKTPIFYAPATFYDVTPDVVKFIREQVPDPRFFRAPNPSGFVLRSPSNDLFWRYSWDRELLSKNYANFYHIPRVFGFDLEASLSYDVSKMTYAAENLNQEKQLALLSAAGVNVFLTPDEHPASGTTLLAKIHNASNVDFFLFHNERSIGRTTFVSNWIFLPDCDQMIKSMLSPNFDPRRYVTLSGAKSDLVLNRCEGKTIVRETRRTMNGSAFETEGGCDGYLVFSESYNEGWHVTVDDADVSLIQANCAFSAIPMKKGKHRVEKTYRPASVQIGSIVSSCAVLVLLLQFFYPVKRKES